MARRLHTALRVVLLVVLVVLLSLVTLAALRGRGERVRVAAVSRGALRVVVSCAGVLQPPAGGELRTPEAGRVAALYKAEGAAVREGEPLLRIDQPDLVDRSLQAQDELLQLEAERAAAAADVVRARADVDRLRALLAGDARLLDQKAIARSAYETSAGALREAEARLASAEGRLAALERDDGGSSRLALARQRARDLAARVAALEVRAPGKGVVYGLPHRVGEALVAGQVVASVTDPDRPQVRVKVDPPDLPRVAEGQRLIVTFDGLPDDRWEGTIHTVSRGLREAGGREVAEVIGEIGDPRHVLPLNASVNVEVVVGERPSGLLIPRAALQRDGERRFVLRVKDGRADRREVTVGLVGSTEVEVATGLSEGERVILPGARRVSPGERIDAAP